MLFVIMFYLALPFVWLGKFIGYAIYYVIIYPLVMFVSWIIRKIRGQGNVEHKNKKQDGNTTITIERHIYHNEDGSTKIVEETTESTTETGQKTTKKK